MKGTANPNEEEDEHKSGATRGSDVGTPAALPSSSRNGAAADQAAGNSAEAASEGGAVAVDGAEVKYWLPRGRALRRKKKVILLGMKIVTAPR